MQRVIHNLEPVFDARSRVLILGTMPSPASRREAFYYAHPANRFWRALSAAVREPCPDEVAGKRRWLLHHRIALWDVLHSCEIEGASDQSIRNPVPNDIPGLLRAAPIAQVFTTGRRAHDLYQKLLQGESICLPSPSAANCAMPLEALIERYRAVAPFLGEDCEDIAT